MSYVENLIYARSREKTKPNDSLTIKLRQSEFDAVMNLCGFELMLRRWQLRDNANRTWKL